MRLSFTPVEVDRSYIDTLSADEEEVRSMLCFSWDMDAVNIFLEQARIRQQQEVADPPVGISFVNPQEFVLSVLDFIVTRTDAGDGVGVRPRFGITGFGTTNEGDFGVAFCVTCDFGKSDWVRTTRQVRIPDQTIGVPLATLLRYEKEEKSPFFQGLRVDLGRLTLLGNMATIYCN